MIASTSSGEIKNQEGYHIHRHYPRQPEVLYHCALLLHPRQHTQRNQQPSNHPSDVRNPINRRPNRKQQ